jgi:DNA invertase Pin-like site-specific DNA recombinase
MSVFFDPPLLARSGGVLKVLGIARISTEHQDRLSLADQEALYRAWLAQHSTLPFDLSMIRGRGSGECLDRAEAFQATAAVETGGFDLVISEDLGRIFRRVHAQLFCELCEDVGTRLIAINDHVDTGREDWKLHAFFATMRHEMCNADTGKRIRRSLRNRFLQGGVVQTTVFGIIKPEGAKTDAELQKDPTAEPIYEEMFRRLEAGASYSEIADWLEEKKIPLPPYARSTRWTCSLLSQLIHNPILKGVRVRNRKISKRVNQTGRRKSVAAPVSERLERHCPHLAFIDPARYDRLVRMLDERNAKFRRKGRNGVDPRKNVPKKRTVWPGQHIDCGVCGRPYVYGGHGQKDHLMCQGARDYRCWNGHTVDAPLAREKLLAAIYAAIAGLPEFDPVLLGMIREEQQQQLGDRDRQLQELDRRRADLERQIANVLAAIRQGGHSPSLLAELARLERERDLAAEERQRRGRTACGIVALPTAAEVKALAAEEFGNLAEESPEFGRLLRRLIPRIVVRPYRLCDGGDPGLRAGFRLSLAPLLPPTPSLENLAGALARELVVDLFDPPQREAYRVPVMALTACGLTQREIAWELDITQTAVQRAVALARRMEQLDLKDAYQCLAAPVGDDKQYRRHLHPRYRFDPLPGAGQVPPGAAG